VSTAIDRLTAALGSRYRLERELGAGGMATVYLARDLRHDRDVALKVLHPELAAALGAERFLAEIRVTANLQHPHILPLHDSGEADGFLFYVMPFVRGESLRDRLLRERQLPIAETVAIARDVASALDYAHRQGVIHRDIKPENILLHDGRPLIADFGIALAVSAAGGARMTQTGLSLGTPQYMSPEQAVGERTIDARSDVYALGAVVYEMLTGEPPFSGATVQAIVAKIMTEKPVPPSRVRDTVAPHVEAAVLTALAKLPADRFSSIAAFAAALIDPAAARPAIPAASPARGAHQPWRAAAIGLGTLAAVLAIGLALASRGRISDPTTRAPLVRFEVPLPDALDARKVVLTPDGTRLLLSTTTGVFAYTLADGRLTQFEIPGVKAVEDIDVSPDGSTLVFLESRSVKVMPLAGGPIRTIADRVLELRSGNDGFVYMTRGRQILRAPLAAGDAEELFKADSVFGELESPVPVPGGRGVLFALSKYAPAEVQIAALDLASRQAKLLSLPKMTIGAPVAVTPSGHLIYRAADALFAVRFDSRRLTISGSPERLMGIPNARWVSLRARAMTYIHRPWSTPVIVDRRGTRRSLANVPSNLWFSSAFVSPDGAMLAHQVIDAIAGRQDIWTYRMPDGPLTRLTSAEDAFYFTPRWTADGKSIRYVAVAKNAETMYTVPRDGGAAPSPVSLVAGELSYGIANHPDGRRIAFTDERGLVLAATGGQDSGVVISGPRSQPQYPHISPDGRWIAFTEQERDRFEVVVRSLDGGSARWQVSPRGGRSARWSRDGRTLYFTGSDSLHAAEWRASEPRVGAVRALFALGSIAPAGYDPLPEDTGFVMVAPNADERAKIVVLLNYVESLNALAAAGAKRD
jgi:eukaryotic-like serine/threonine-protein kinase